MSMCSTAVILLWALLVAIGLHSNHSFRVQQASYIGKEGTATDPDFYAVLGVSQDADTKEIKQAYHKLAMKHHPDRGGDVAKFKEVGEANDCLSDDECRADYDRKLRMSQRQPSAPHQWQPRPSAPYQYQETPVRPPTTRKYHPVGTVVVLTGLQDKPELNGRRGIVHGWDDASRRWKVKLDGESTMKAFKVENVVKPIQPLEPGSYVRIVGLQLDPQSNGRQGVVLRWVYGSARWAVRMDDDGKEALLKPENLEEVDEEPE